MQITAALSRTDAPFPKLEAVDLGEPRANEILVRIVATGICHTDLMFHGPFGERFATKPMVLGHEGAGVVEAIGSAVQEFAVGDHVVLSGNSCGHCASCHSGQPLARQITPEVNRSTQNWRRLRRSANVQRNAIAAPPTRLERISNDQSASLDVPEDLEPRQLSQARRRASDR